MYRFSLARLPLSAILGATLLAAPAQAALDFVAVDDSSNAIVAATVSGSYTGAAWVDADEDGLLDLCIVRKARFYRNVGGGQFEFVAAALQGQGNTLGTTWSDYDNDGDLDVFFSGNPTLGTRGSFLYRNDGNFSFSKITTGDIGDAFFNAGWGCAWADVNNDGYTDVVVAAANGFNGVNHENRFFYNNGDGTFTRVDSTVITAELDAHTIPTWSDYDLDGDQDLFIGSGEISQLDPDNLFQNRLAEDGDWGFERITTAPIATDSLDGQVWNWIDFDNDGDLDAFQTNYANLLSNNLYRNDAGTYVKMTDADVGPIVNTTGSSLANNWADFDNDGDLDCLVTNDGAGLNQYFHNDGDGTFTQELASPLVTEPGPHYGASAGDYDNDGDLDLYVHGSTATKRLWRNDLANGNGWLNVRLVGAGPPLGSNLAAIGAMVRVKATIGGSPVWQMREISSQNSFNAMNMLNAHFGLGDAAVVDSLVITWPAGGTDVYVNVPKNRFLRLVEGQDPTGAPEVGAATGAGSLGRVFPNPFSGSAQVEFDLRVPSHVSLEVFDTAGRRVRSLAQGRYEAGRHALTWNGRGESGAAAAAGVYFVRLKTDGAEVGPARKVVLHR